jgi:hypothetical protein
MKGTVPHTTDSIINARGLPGCRLLDLGPERANVPCTEKMYFKGRDNHPYEKLC